MIEKTCTPAFLFYNIKNLQVPVSQNNPLGGANKLHNHCINNLLNIKDVIVKKLFMLILLWKSSLKPLQRSIYVHAVAPAQWGFMTTECRPSRTCLSNGKLLPCFKETALRLSLWQTLLRKLRFSSKVFPQDIQTDCFYCRLTAWYIPGLFRCTKM